MRLRHDNSFYRSIPAQSTFSILSLWMNLPSALPSLAYSFTQNVVQFVQVRSGQVQQITLLVCEGWVTRRRPGHSCTTCSPREVKLREAIILSFVLLPRRFVHQLSTSSLASTHANVLRPHTTTPPRPRPCLDPLSTHPTPSLFLRLSQEVWTGNSCAVTHQSCEG